MNLATAFDALTLVSEISQLTSARSRDGLGATEQEVHSLAYLACLLAHWEDPDLPWVYTFYATPQAQPFAAAVSDALRDLRSAGHVLDSGPLLSLSSSGEALLSRLSALASVQPRAPYLRAAAGAAALLPTPLVLQALSHEPTVAAGIRARPLLDEQASNVLAAYHDALRSLTGPDASLLAVVELWINFLLIAGGSDVSQAGTAA